MSLSDQERDLSEKGKKLELSRTPLESALFQISECAVSTRSVNEYAQRLHKIIRQLMYAENFFVVLYTQDRSLINFVYIADEYDSEIENTVLNELTAEELRRTLTGYMLRTGKTQHLDRKKMDSLVEKNIVDSVGVDSYDWLGVPLKYDDEIIGGIVIQSYQEDLSYGAREEGVLQFVARQIALVFKSKQAEQTLIDAYSVLEKRVEERTRDLNRMNGALAKEVLERKKSENIQSALFQISELVSTSHSINDLYKSVHTILSRLMPAENEYIALLSDDRKRIFFPYFIDEQDPTPETRNVDLTVKGVGFTEKILKQGEAFLFYRKDLSDKGSIGSKCVSFLGVPLKDGSQTFGVLAVQSYQKDVVYDEKNKEVLLTIGQQVATAILRKNDAHSLLIAHENLEKRVKERTYELEKTIEKRKVVEEQLAHDSLHDSLTGLPNRVHLSNTLNKLISRCDDKEDKVLALLFLDLDRFKIINDSLGHHVGDLFLQNVASRLKSCLRTNDLVARLGGDEFCILMPEIPKEEVALRLCNRLLDELRSPVEVANHSLITSASIGVRIANRKEKSVEIIMSDADAAMYQAKQQGKNRYCFFDSDIKEIVTKRMKMERDLRDAVEQEQLLLVFQPLVDFNANKIIGFEALVRWNHPKNGLIGPVDFIPVAEETGLIVEIGEAVVDMACQTLARFKKEPLLADLYVNVNVSSVQILARTLDDFIRKSLTKYDIDAEKLNIEITESILIEDYKAALSFVRELKSMGISIYLDDFGTGYSSLSYLYKFPFDTIKLDRSFIVAIDDSRSSRSIVESIGLLAKNLDINIVAEGIETRHQLDTIRRMNYQIAQGYYFSKPIEEDLVMHYVQNFN